MQKIIVGGLLGGIILFIWQFLSWTALNIHAKENVYTPNQQQIIDCLTAAGLTDGEYMVPGLPPGSTAEEREAFGADIAGKPWAKIKYGSSFSPNMGMNMLRGFVVNFISALLLCWLLLKIPDLSFSDVLLGSLVVAGISWLNMSYIESIWFETSSIGNLIDALASWGLVGACLGWWLRR